MARLTRCRGSGLPTISCFLSSSTLRYTWSPLSFSVSGSTLTRSVASDNPLDRHSSPHHLPLEPTETLHGDCSLEMPHKSFHLRDIYEWLRLLHPLLLDYLWEHLVLLSEKRLSEQEADSFAEQSHDGIPLCRLYSDRIRAFIRSYCASSDLQMVDIELTSGSVPSSDPTDIRDACAEGF